MTPLLVASENGHGEVVKKLLSAGADIHQRRAVSTCISMSPRDAASYSWKLSAA